MSPHTTRSGKANYGHSSARVFLPWINRIAFVAFATLLLSSAFSRADNEATLKICSSSFPCATNATQFKAGDTVYITGTGWDITSEDVVLQITESGANSHSDVLKAIVHENGTIDAEYVVPGHGDSGQSFTLTATQHADGSEFHAEPIEFTNEADPTPYTWDTSSWTTPEPAEDEIPWVRTDRDDYPPGDTVYIAGGGYSAGELVILTITETGPQAFHGAETVHAVADNAGNIYAGYVIQEHDLGQQFTLTAKGQTSGKTAKTWFTDGISDYSTTITPSSVSASSSNTFTLTLSNTSTTGSNVLGYGQITVPSSFSVTAFSAIVSAPTGKSWNISRTGNIITVAASANSSRIGRGEQISFTVTATAPSTSGINTWNWSSVREKTDGTGTQFTLVDSAATVTVTTACSAPSITTQPANATKTVGESVTFTVVASGGTTPYSYQWRKNGSNISGATSSSYPIASVLASDAGNYDVVVSSNCGSAPSNSVTSNSASLTVTKANQTITVNTAAPSSAAFNATFNVAATGGASGNPVVIASSGACSGGGNGSATITMTSGTGTCTVTYNQDGNSNYNAATQVSNTTTATKLTPVISWPSPGDITYGTALSSTQLNAVASLNGSSIPGAFVYNPAAGVVLSAGNGQSLSVQFTPTATSNYETVQATTTINVLRATPTITWSNPADIVYGTALGSSQLNATANVQGSFAYNPDTGAVLNAGDGQTLHVDFTPANTTNYNNASKSVAINVLKANQSITFSVLTGKTYGDADFTVSASATSNLPVSFAVAPSTVCTISGNTVHLEGAGECTITAQQAGDDNYNPASPVQQSFTIAKATPTFSNLLPLSPTTGYGSTPTTLGGHIEANNLDVPGGVNITVNGVTKTATIHQTDSSAADLPLQWVAGDFSVDFATDLLDVKEYVITYEYEGSGNFETVTDQSKKLTVTKKTLQVKANNKTMTFGGGAPDFDFTYDPAPADGQTIDTPPTCTVDGSHADAGSYDISCSGGNDNNYDFTYVTGTLTVDRADAVCTVTGYSGKYDGAAHGASGSCTGVGGASLSGLNLGATFTNVPGGTAHWTFSGGTNYNDTSGDVDITITKASAIISVNGYTGVYDGNLHGASGTATGVGGADLSASLNLGATFTNVPGGTAHWTFSGGGNYDDDSGEVSISITKATVTATAGSGSDIYDGAKKTPSACELSGAYIVGLTCSNNPATVGPNAGTTTIAPVVNGAGLGNFEVSSVSGSYTITQATSTTVVSCPPSVTYNGATQTPCTVEVNGEGGLNLTPDAAYTDNVNAGQATASYTFAGDDNHTGSNDNGNFTIDKADATIVVTPYNVTYDGNEHIATGTAKGVNDESLNGLDLNGTKHTNAGDYPADPWTFTDETGNYKDATGTVYDVIAKLDAVCEVTGYSGTYDGDAHGASGNCKGVGNTILSGLDLGAKFTNVPGGTANWTFTGGTNYNDKNGSVAITLGKANAVCEVTGYSDTYDGAAHGATGSCTGVGGGTLSGLDLGAKFTNVPGGTANWNFTGGTNYNDKNGSVNIDISKADAACTINGYAGTYDGAEHGASGSCIGIGGAVLSGLNLGATFVDVPGGIATWNFTGGQNYNDDNGEATIAIGKASSTTTVSCSPSSVPYSGLPKTPCTATVNGVGGLNVTDVPTYVNNVDAGQATASYTFAGDDNHTGSNDSKTFTIVQLELTITADNKTVQYSDPVPAFTVKYNGFVAGQGPSVLGGTLTCTTTAVVTSGNVTSGPGSYDITCSGLTADNYAISYGKGALTVTQENATATYSGPSYFATASPTSNTATVTVAATVVDMNDSARGDIRKATVEFHRDSPSGPLLGSAPVGLISNSDLTTGTATMSFPHTLNNSDMGAGGTTLTIYVVVKGYYTSSTEQTNLTISVPGTDSVNGGGFLSMQSSSGQYAGAPNSKMNFGYTMKYNKSGKNLQGQANIIIRAKDGKVYQIKSNAIDSLAVVGSAYPKNGTFVTKANLTDITNPFAPIAMGGNMKLQVDMTDKATGGQTDMVGVTLWNVDGGLFFASNWSGTQSVQQILGGGNISVR